jgi:hypothetical protein
MPNLNELSETLRDRVGVAFGDIPGVKRFTLIQAGDSGSSELYSKEAILDRVQALDFALIDSRCFYLSHISQILNRLTEVLCHHGLIILVAPRSNESSELVKQVHQILSLGSIELLSDTESEKETIVVFRWLRSDQMSRRRSDPAKPFRYEVADRINNTLSRFPNTKRLIRRTLGW